MRASLITNSKESDSTTLTVENDNCRSIITVRKAANNTYKIFVTVNKRASHLALFSNETQKFKLTPDNKLLKVIDH